MLSQATLQTLSENGLYALARPHADSPGYTGILIMLANSQHEPLVAPDSVSAWLADRETACQWVQFTAAHPRIGHHQLAFGGVLAEKQQGAMARLFVFGGEVNVQATELGPVMIVQSAAPILAQLNRINDTVVDQLAAQAEVLLAEWCSLHEWTEQEARQHLAHIAPETLYLTCLRAILEKFDPHLSLQRAEPALYTMLQRERAWYEQQAKWHNAALSLEALL